MGDLIESVNIIKQSMINALNLIDKCTGLIELLAGEIDKLDERITKLEELSNDKK